MNTKNEKRWRRYQIGTEDSGYKTIADATESEAKNELCKAMDLITKITNQAQSIVDSQENWANG